MKFIICYRTRYMTPDEKNRIVRLFGPVFQQQLIEDIVFIEGADRDAFEVLEVSDDSKTGVSKTIDDLVVVDPSIAIAELKLSSMK